MNWEQGSHLAGIIQAAAVIIVGLWAYFRFRKERTHYPHIEFSVDCNVFESTDDKKRIAEFMVNIKNKGFVQQRFMKINLTVRILDDLTTNLFTFQEFKKTRKLGKNSYKRLYLPEKLMKNVDIVPPKYKPYVVEPGCEEIIRYITPLPSNVKHMLIHAKYYYPELVRPDLKNWLYVFILVKFHIQSLFNKIWPPGYPTRPRTTEKFIQVEPIKDKTNLSE